MEILEAGRWAPSAGNSQPWNFILLKDEQVKKNVADATTNGGFLAEASIGIALSKEKVKEMLDIPKKKRLLSIISIGYPAESCLKSSLRKTRKELYR